MRRDKERKFLVSDDSWMKCTFTSRDLIRQFYISCDDICIGVRMVNEASETKSPHAYITIKNNECEEDIDEFEWEIPIIDAYILSKFTKSRIIQKLRYIIPARQDDYWVVDEYIGEDAGLVIAEHEYKESSYFPYHPACYDKSLEFNIPYWIGEEVTGDPKYYDTNIAKHKTSFVNRLWKRILRLMS